MSLTIRELRQHFTDLWWESATSLPDLGRTYTPGEQAVQEKKLEHFLKQINAELAHPPHNREAAQLLQERLGAASRQFAQEALGIDAGQFNLLPADEFSAAAQDFVRQARAFDPEISSADIYQAGRNAWTANGLQYLLGLPVRCSASIFAYSMLYPYTDNYLDDASIPGATKMAFNERFRQRLYGQAIAPANAHEGVIFKLVGMIEQEYARAKYAEVYESLLAIHAGQTRSLQLVRPNAAPGEVDVLGISIEKGGTSVMADGYLAGGTLTPEERLFSFGHGVYAQLLDDLEDVEQDRAEGRLTMYTQAAGHWPLDALTNRTIHFGEKVLINLDRFKTAEPVKKLIRQGAKTMFVDTASRAERFYSQAYMRELEAHSPYRFSFLSKQRKDFNRKYGSVIKLIETFAPMDALEQSFGMDERLPNAS